MFIKYINRVFIYTLLLVLFFISDRLSKYFFYQNPQKEVFLFSKKNFSLWFEFSKNYNIAFGIKINQGLLYTLIIITIALLLILIIKSIFKFDAFQAFLIGLIFAGAVSNLIDRLTFGYAIDFIHLTVKGWPWPVFNIADVCITLGVVGWFFKKL